MSRYKPSHSIFKDCIFPFESYISSIRGSEVSQTLRLVTHVSVGQLTENHPFLTKKHSSGLRLCSLSYPKSRKGDNFLEKQTICFVFYHLVWEISCHPKQPTIYLSLAFKIISKHINSKLIRRKMALKTYFCFFYCLFIHLIKNTNAFKTSIYFIAYYLVLSFTF